MTAASPWAGYRFGLCTQRAARALTRRLDAALAGHHLTSGQVYVMERLDRREPPLIGEVAVSLSMDRTTLTANLKPLQRRGLIEVAVDAADRRARRLRLTGSGRLALASAARIMTDAQATISRQGGIDLTTLSHDLERVADVCGA